MTKRPGKLALSGLLLAGMGYAIGVLTAPKSGKETRKDIQKAAIRAKKEAEKNLKTAHAEISHLVDQVKKSKIAKAEVEKAVKVGLEAKEKIRLMLSAIHEGDSEDKDLQHAINEANKAIKHLNQFVRKNANTKKAK